MAQQAHVQNENETKANEEQNQYALTVSILQNKLELHLLDTKTKYLYHGSFDSDALHKQCGFYLNQAQNLQTAGKLIESARSGHQGLQFAISIKPNENTQVENADFAVITITKQDEFFPLHIVMKLKQTPRKEIDVIMEHIKDLQAENGKLKERITKHAMPKGSIVMWSGNADNIPNGWKLCDGQNGTPDLQNRFVFGASPQITVATTGGNQAHTHDITVNAHRLSVNEMPAHTHAPPHADKHHGVMYRWKAKTGCSASAPSNTANDQYVNWLVGASQKTGGNQPHSHTARAVTTNHMPPYFALCFIMKTI